MTRNASGEAVSRTFGRTGPPRSDSVMCRRRVRPLLVPILLFVAVAAARSEPARGEWVRPYEPVLPGTEPRDGEGGDRLFQHHRQDLRRLPAPLRAAKDKIVAFIGLEPLQIREWDPAALREFQPCPGGLAVRVDGHLEWRSTTLDVPIRLPGRHKDGNSVF